MKKLVILLFLVLLVRSVSAEDVGCCCSPDGIPPDFTYPQVPESICGGNNIWVQYDGSLTGSSGAQEFQDFCNAQCGEITPPDNSNDFYSISGTIFDEENNPVPGADIFVNLRGSIGVGYAQTDINGDYFLTNIPEQNALTLWAVKPACTTASAVFSLKRDITGADLSLDCSIPTCNLLPVSIQEINPLSNSYVGEIVPDSEDIALITEECQSNVENVLVDVCMIYDGIQDCKTLPYSNNINDIFNEISSEINFADLGFGTGGWLDHLPPALPGDDYFEVSFRIGLRYGKDWAWSPFYKMDLGNQSCWLNSGEFCAYDYINGNDAIVECNNLRLVEASEENICDENTFCSTDRNGNPSCLLDRGELCNSCNSVTGMFPDVFKIITDAETLEVASCTELVNDDSYGTCFKAGSPTAQDYYDSCANVRTCYDYTTKESCTQMPCGTVGSAECNWLPASPGILGKGLCAPVGEFECTQCSDVYGEDCTQEICEGLGCAFGYRGDSSICLPESRVACVNYQTEEECVGDGEGVSLAVTYSGIGNDRYRSAGTNMITAFSNDTYGKGICLWAEDSDGNPACIRDADGDREEDDCPGNFLDIVCEADNEPPVTYISLENDDSISLEDLLDAEVVVTDNVFSSGFIDTYFCLQTINNYCYPDSSLENLRVDEEGRYTLKFYSEDRANNLEVIQEISLNIVDTTLPGVIRAELLP